MLNGTEATIVPAAGNIVAAELKHQNLEHLNAGARSFREHVDQFDISSSLLSIVTLTLTLVLSIF